MDSKDLLSRAREIHGLSRIQLADLLGASVEDLRLWEEDENSNPTGPDLLLLRMLVLAPESSARVLLGQSSGLECKD